MSAAVEDMPHLHGLPHDVTAPPPDTRGWLRTDHRSTKRPQRRTTAASLAARLPLMTESNPEIERLLTERANGALSDFGDCYDRGTRFRVSFKVFDIGLRPLAANYFFLLSQNGAPSMLKALSSTRRDKVDEIIA